MKIIIVRHGDPDYSIDSLTEKGWKEAKLAAKRIEATEKYWGGIRKFYVSPMGRAQDTARCTLERMGRTAETCEWLREFSPRIWRPDVDSARMITWDWLPQDWTKEPRYYDAEEWKNVECMKEGSVAQEYQWVCDGLDAILKENGYERYDGEKGHYYTAVAPNNEAIVLFCHFGVECVMLSHLMGCSPMILWHTTCAAPSTITVINSEERREGVAIFRMSQFGDVSHLYVDGEQPSFAARFCECFANEDERHDGF